MVLMGAIVIERIPDAAYRALVQIPDFVTAATDIFVDIAERPAFEEDEARRDSLHEVVFVYHDGDFDMNGVSEAEDSDFNSGEEDSDDADLQDHSSDVSGEDIVIEGIRLNARQ